MQIQLDAERIVSGIIAALIIQLGRDCIPYIKQFLGALGKGLLRAAVSPFTWVGQQSDLILMRFSFSPPFARHDSLKNPEF